MLVIRLIRTGKRNKADFRVVLTEKTAPPKSGRFLELLGHYNPHQKEVGLKKERIKYWISKGAQASDTVHNLLVKEEIIKGPKIKKKIKIKKKKTTEKPKEKAPAKTQDSSEEPESKENEAEEKPKEKKEETSEGNQSSESKGTEKKVDKSEKRNRIKKISSFVEKVELL